MRHQPKLIITPALPLETIIAMGAPSAFERVRKEIAAVPRTSLVRRNLNIPRAVRRGLMAAERLESLRAELSVMSHLDHAKVETMPTYALALIFAHEQLVAAEEAAVPLARLLAKAVPLRADLMKTGEMLAHFGVVSSEQMARIRAGQGHADTADDLLALGLLLGGLWPQIKDKVMITREQIDLAILLSAQLQQAIGVREAGDEDPLAEPNDAYHVRAQALQLFVAAYEECRRGVSHLRWHEGDAARIVPSLYPGRGPGKKAGENEGIEGNAAEGGLEAAPAREPKPERVAETAAKALALA